MYPQGWVAGANAPPGNGASDGSKFAGPPTAGANAPGPPTIIPSPGGQVGHGTPGISGMPTKPGTGVAAGAGGGSGVAGVPLPGSAGPGGIGAFSSAWARTSRWPHAGRGAPRATVGGPRVTTGAPAKAGCQRASCAYAELVANPSASPTLVAQM